MIIAKTVIPNQYWILKQDDRKIGNIEAAPDGFNVVINGSRQIFKNLHTIKKRVSIDFQNLPKPVLLNPSHSVHGYPTDSPPYNGVYDVRHHVPLWTREPRSKSWYAAGWYRIQHGRTWHTVFCPKMIMLNRNQFQGPFYSQCEAEIHEPSHQ